MMASGSHPGRGKYGENVKSALQLRPAARRPAAAGRSLGMHPPAFLHNSSHVGQQGPMYSHGFGTLLLGEVCGMVADKPLANSVHTGLAKAVKVTVRARRERRRRLALQSHAVRRRHFGHRLPDHGPALGPNAGVFVPKSVVDRCIEYVKGCQNRRTARSSIRGTTRRFAFGNMGGGFARTAAGVAALYSAGIYIGQEIDIGLRYLVRSSPACARRARPTCTISTAITTPSRPCGPPAASTGPTGIPAIRDELVRIQVNRRLLARPALHPLRHRDGLHHPAGAQQLPAHLAEVTRTPCRESVRGGRRPRARASPARCPASGG